MSRTACFPGRGVSQKHRPPAPRAAPPTHRATTMALKRIQKVRTPPGPRLRPASAPSCARAYLVSGTQGSSDGPSVVLQRRTCRQRFVPLASHYHWTRASTPLVDVAAHADPSRRKAARTRVASSSWYLSYLQTLQASLTCPGHPLPHRLSFQASKGPFLRISPSSPILTVIAGQIHHQGLPPQHQL